MQVFLPYPDIKQSLQSLDYRRLGKQRVEANQIINILEKKVLTNAWRNHPAVLMFVGFTDLLKWYYNSAIDEWIGRGYNNTMSKQESCIWEETKFPAWWGDDRFHSSHRSKLLFKDPKFYCRYGWTEPNNLEYFWPSKEGF